MEKIKNKFGISLIVLVITILVMIILAGVVVVTMSENNPIAKAKDAKFRSNSATYVDDLSMTIANRVSLGNTEKINATETDIRTYIPSISKEDAKKYIIKNDVLCYVGNNKEEEKAALEMGIKVNNKVTVYSKVFTGAEVTRDGSQLYIEKTVEERDNFVIEFRAKPLATTNLEARQDNLNNVLAPQNTLLPPAFFSGPDSVGVGINIGTNGLNIIEHQDSYYGFKCVYKADLSAVHDYKIELENGTYYVYIDGNLVISEKTTKKPVCKFYDLFNCAYGKYIGEIYNISVAK